MDVTGDRAVVEHPVAATAGYLGAEEAMAAVEALSEDDTLKVMAVERMLLGGTGRDAGDLYHEAVCKTLLGERRCPKDIPVIAFLIETMRSIASHDRDRTRKARQRHVADDGGALEQVPSADPDPEQALIESEKEAAKVLRSIEGAFEGDEEAELLLMAWDEGLKGKSLRETLGMDQAQLDYLVKRVRRKARKMYPAGWKQ